MALNTQSLSAAVKKKAARAHEKVLAAKAELGAANTALKVAVPKHDMAKIEEAAKRTVVAEEEIREVAQELEAVELLLEQQAAPAQAPGTRSGQGAKSVMPHLKGKDGA